MTAASRRGARAEARAARALGTRRVHRERGESAPDLVPIPLPGGAVLGPEVKARKALPRLVVDALAQARRYFGRSAIPIAILFERGARGGLVALGLDAFARLVGLEVAAVPKPRSTSTKRRKRWAQLPLPGLEVS